MCLLNCPPIHRLKLFTLTPSCCVKQLFLRNTRDYKNQDTWMSEVNLFLRSFCLFVFCFGVGFFFLGGKAFYLNAKSTHSVFPEKNPQHFRTKTKSLDCRVTIQFDVTIWKIIAVDHCTLSSAALPGVDFTRVRTLPRRYQKCIASPNTRRVTIPNSR